MTEWTVIGVLIALVGLIGAVVGPVVKLNTSITRLAVTMDGMDASLKELTDKNTKSHQRLWDKNDQQDKQLADHEYRIKTLESDKGE